MVPASGSASRTGHRTRGMARRALSWWRASRLDRGIIDTITVDTVILLDVVVGERVGVARILPDGPAAYASNLETQTPLLCRRQPFSSNSSIRLLPGVTY